MTGNPPKSDSNRYDNAMPPPDDNSDGNRPPQLNAVNMVFAAVSESDADSDAALGSQLATDVATVDSSQSSGSDFGGTLRDGGPAVPTTSPLPLLTIAALDLHQRVARHECDGAANVHDLVYGHGLGCKSGPAAHLDFYLAGLDIQRAVSPSERRAPSVWTISTDDSGMVFVQTVDRQLDDISGAGAWADVVPPCIPDWSSGTLVDDILEGCRRCRFNRHCRHCPCRR